MDDYQQAHPSQCSMTNGSLLQGTHQKIGHICHAALRYMPFESRSSQAAERMPEVPLTWRTSITPVTFRMQSMR